MTPSTAVPIPTITKQTLGALTGMDKKLATVFIEMGKMQLVDDKAQTGVRK